jgi:hypothetical protein
LTYESQGLAQKEKLTYESQGLAQKERLTYESQGLAQFKQFVPGTHLEKPSLTKKAYGSSYSDNHTLSFYKLTFLNFL